MKSGADLVKFAKTLIPAKYVLGALVPKNKVGYNGPYDCAEFQSYTIFQVCEFLFGTDTHDVKKAAIADAYTGYCAKDAATLGTIIMPAEAAQIPGALLLRKPKPGAIGHIIMSQGNGKSVEANCTKLGCGEFGITGRRFDIGILLNGVEYAKPNTTVTSVAPAVVYRLKTPFMTGDFVAKLQKALGLTEDGVFGPETNNTVVYYQRMHGLIVDGEVMPGGQTAKLLKI